MPSDTEDTSISQSRFSRFSPLVTVLSTSSGERDVVILFLQRIVRMFAFACSTLVLTLLLSAEGNSERSVGLFMSATLAGEVIVGFLTSLTADCIGRRTVLCLGSLLMAISGVVFATSNNFWTLLAASIAGVITPSGNDIGPFKAIEESVMSQLIPPERYNVILAWYYTLGSWATALGTIGCGWVVQALQNNRWSPLETYHLVFWSYAGMGLVKFVLSLMLSNISERSTAVVNNSEAVDNKRETEPLLDHNKPQTPSKRSFPVSKATSWFLLKLCFVFLLDSLGAGLASNSWMIYFVKTKFHLNPGYLGSIFSVSNFLMALSNVLAIPFVTRIGLINSMLLGHVLSSTALLLLPFLNGIAGATLMLMIRAIFLDFHQPARQTFISQSVLPEERTAVIGIVNVVRTVAQSPGPAITGLLAQHGMLWVSFALAGAIKLFYNITLLVFFADPV